MFRKNIPNIPVNNFFVMPACFSIASWIAKASKNFIMRLVMNKTYLALRMLWQFLPWTTKYGY